MSPDFYLSSSALQAPPEAVLAHALQHGYAGVEWYLDQRRLPIAPDARGRLFKTIRLAGLGIRFHAPAADVELGHRDPAIADTSLRYLTMYIGFLADVAPTILTVHIGSRSIPMDLLSWDTTLAHLRQVATAGREHGVTVCLENLKRGWTSDPTRLLAMAEAANSSITLDLGHANASPFVRDGGTLESFAGIVMARVVNVHVYALETPEGRHQPLETLNGHGRALDRLLAHERRTWVLELSNTEDLATTRRTLERYREG